MCCVGSGTSLLRAGGMSNSLNLQLSFSTCTHLCGWEVKIGAGHMDLKGIVSFAVLLCNER